MGLTRRGFVGSAASSAILLPVGAHAETQGTARAMGRSPAPTPTLLEAAPGSLEHGEGRHIGFDGIAGRTPGPVLHARAGEPLAVHFVNGLDHPTRIHWRGVRLANAMDGSVLTQAPVPPGGSFDYAFTPPDAGTFAYEAAGPGAERGPVGVLVVAEREPPAFDGDLVVALQDWKSSDGSGPVRFTVNGRSVPDAIMAPAGARLRLRLANLSRETMRIVGIEGAKTQVIAIDGQPCDPFQPLRDSVPITPGARFDLLCDLAAPPSQARLVLREGEQPVPLVRFEQRGTPPSQPRPAFAGLPANPLLPARIALEKAARADLVLVAEGTAGPGQNLTFGGVAGSLETRPVLSAKRGTPVSLGFVNRTAELQPIHIHGHVLRQLHLLDDGWDPFWRDSIAVMPGRTVRVAFVADNPGRWMIESALPARSAAGLWTWFEVT